MKAVFISASLLLCSMPGLAAVVSLGQSTQEFGLTGIGPNASGQGQSRISWGTCSFDGTTTACTLSGTFTGIGKGGTYSLTVSYPGNGAFPLNAITAPGSNLFSAQATGNFSFAATLAETGGPTTSYYSFANLSIQYTNPACTGVPSCGPGIVGQTSKATITGQVTGVFNTAPTIAASGVVNATNFGGVPSIASGTWIEIYGANLATNTRSRTWTGADFNGTQAPTSLGGTTVTVAGKPAFVYFVSPGQVNVQAPAGIPPGQQPVVVTTAGGINANYTVPVSATQPGLLAPPSFIVRGNQHVVALFSNTLTYVLPVAIPGAATARAKPGDNLTLYGIGFGPVVPDTPAGQITQLLNSLQADFRFTIGGVPAVVTYAGLAPGYVGLYQFNVVVPKVGASDAVPVAFTLGGAGGSQTLVIAIQD